MSCDFKPGDEVVCIKTRFLEPAPAWMFWTRTRPCRDGAPVKGAIYTVQAVSVETFPGDAPEPYVALTGFSGMWTARSFRKVERRTDKQSLTEWLKQPSGDTDHLDKPLPAKKRERAQ